jgi:hypothetical protein
VLRTTITALALAGVLSAGACGGNDDKAAGADKASSEESGDAAASAEKTGSAAFCASAKSLYDQLTTAGSADPTSPEVQAVFAEAQALEAPPEIADDWKAILDLLVAPVVRGELDVKDPAGASALAERAAQVGDSLQRTGTYFETECGFVD